MHKTRLWLAFVLVVLMSDSYSEIYKWVDDNGKVHFSDKKPEDAQSQQVKLKINTYKSISYDKSIFENNASKVVMYSASWCGYCKKARNYFNANNISFAEYDVEKDAEAKKRYKAMGATGVPVIIVGNKRMNGFSVAGFRRIYN